MATIRSMVGNRRMRQGNLYDLRSKKQNKIKYGYRTGQGSDIRIRAYSRSGASSLVRFINEKAALNWLRRLLGYSHFRYANVKLGDGQWQHFSRSDIHEAIGEWREEEEFSLWDFF